MGLRCIRDEHGVRSVFTTGEISKICKVASRTVAKWCDSGRLPCYKIPDSLDRRVHRRDLLAFLKEHNLPLGDLEGEGVHRILLVCTTGRFRDALRSKLKPESVEFELAMSVFEAGVLTASFKPHTVIVDLAIGRPEAIAIANTVASLDEHEDTHLVALASEDETAPEELYSRGFADVFKKPDELSNGSIALLSEKILARAV